MLSKEIIMISGGSAGIGLAAAKRLGGKGAKISICARSPDRLHEAEHTLSRLGIRVLAVQADVSRPDDVEAWFDQTENYLGSATVLVNNAGVSGYGSFMELTEEQWDTTMSVNCRGVFLCTRRALPNMIKARRGRIVMISSIAAQYFRRDHSLYFASKWALNGFSHCLAKEVREHNIHVHIVCPGMTETSFFDSIGGRPHPQDREYVTPETVAELVEFFCTLPDHVDTNEYSLFPSWQLRNLGIRR